MFNWTRLCVLQQNIGACFFASAYIFEAGFGLLRSLGAMGGLFVRRLSTTCLFFNGLLLNFSTTSSFFNIGRASNVNFSPSVSRTRLYLDAASFLASPPCALIPWLLDGARTSRIAPLKTSFTCECQLPLRTLDIVTPTIS